MRPLLLLGLAGAVFAQGTTPKAKPEDYPVHAQARSAAIGAEFMIHSVSGGEQTYIVKGYLVVEVAMYPPPGQVLDVHSGNFVMRVNGHKQELLPQPPYMVAASVQHPEWNEQPGPHVEADANMGAGGVSIGRPRPTQIPGVPIPGQQAPPQVPKDNPSGLPHREHVKPDQLVRDTALPQGEHRGPVSGFLYFAYTGKTSSIKSLELRYEDAVLKLR